MDSIPLKRCTRCKNYLPLEVFNKSKTFRDGLNIYCKKCCAEKKGRVWRPKCLIPDGYRQCGHCGQCLTVDNFQKNHNNHLGLQNVCKECKKIADAEWRSNNLEKSRAKSKARYHAKPEERKQYKETHKEQIAETKRNYRRTHPEAVKKHKRDGNKRFKEREPEKFKLRQKISRIKRQGGKGNVTRLKIIELYHDQNERCAYCGISIYWSVPRDIHIDHVIPLSKGGSNDIDNLALTCHACNESKGDKLLTDWLLVRGW